jgi:hypothetical protein
MRASYIISLGCIHPKTGRQPRTHDFPHSRLSSLTTLLTHNSSYSRLYNVNILRCSHPVYYDTLNKNTANRPPKLAVNLPVRGQSLLNARISAKILQISLLHPVQFVLLNFRYLEGAKTGPWNTCTVNSLQSHYETRQTGLFSHRQLPTDSTWEYPSEEKYSHIESLGLRNNHQ